VAGTQRVALANGMVYAASPTTVFALNAKSGHVIWTDKDLLKKGQGTFAYSHKPPTAALPGEPVRYRFRWGNPARP